MLPEDDTSVETCRSVIICEIIVHLLVIVQNNKKHVRNRTLLYGSETWVTTTRDMTRLEAAEMRFL